MGGRHIRRNQDSSCLPLCSRKYRFAEVLSTSLQEGQNDLGTSVIKRKMRRILKHGSQKLCPASRSILHILLLYLIGAFPSMFPRLYSIHWTLSYRDTASANTSPPSFFSFLISHFFPRQVPALQPRLSSSLQYNPSCLDHMILLLQPTGCTYSCYHHTHLEEENKMQTQCHSLIHLNHPVLITPERSYMSQHKHGCIYNDQMTPVVLKENWY